MSSPVSSPARRSSSRAARSGGWEKTWQTFRRAKPGHRFQDINERHRSTGLARHWWGRLLFWLVGGLLILLGLFFSIAPGPASIFILPGALLIACESRGMARVLDWIDRKLAPVFAWLGRKWQGFPPAAKMVCKIGGAIGTVAGFAFGIFLIVR